MDPDNSGENPNVPDRRMHDAFTCDLQIYTTKIYSILTSSSIAIDRENSNCRWQKQRNFTNSILTGILNPGASTPDTPDEDIELCKIV